MNTIQSTIVDELRRVRAARDELIYSDDARTQEIGHDLDLLERELTDDLTAERWRIIVTASAALITAANRAIGAFEEGHLVGDQDLSIMAHHFERAFDTLNDLDDGAWVVRDGPSLAPSKGAPVGDLRIEDLMESRDPSAFR